MKNLHQDTHQRAGSLRGMEPSTILENTSRTRSTGLNSAPPEEWDRVAKEHPAILREENVFQPKHYIKDGGVECIDVMVQLYGEARVREWAEITAFKYQWRQGNKAGNSPEQDKMKSIWYTRISMGDDPRAD